MELKDLVNFIIDIVKKKNLNKIYDIITIYFNDLKIINKYLKYLSF